MAVCADDIQPSYTMECVPGVSKIGSDGEVNIESQNPALPIHQGPSSPSSSTQGSTVFARGGFQWFWRLLSRRTRMKDLEKGEYSKNDHGGPRENLSSKWFLA